ncbi:hypothetical protein GIB67_015079 [Kingdonia uniflora]|uniref:40S ribosomal protein S12 n=1 Tax=Kingdonia uniflora TaxID=39325 RepID=A0A7J7NNK9_9MAGN|nr:hypothetical protein GIB67_015079 [Kingdonia uniflora]
MSVDRETSKVMKGVQHGACGFVSSNKRAISSIKANSASNLQLKSCLGNTPGWTEPGPDRVNYAGEEAIAVAVETAAPALGEPMDIMTALQLVLKKSLAHDGLARGLHEGAKVIEKHAAQLCVLAEDCDQPDYVKLVKALCADHNVSLIAVPSGKTLGEWAGLCKIDSEGKARKVNNCSCVVVKDYGEESEGLHIVQEYVKSH